MISFISPIQTSPLVNETSSLNNSSSVNDCTSDIFISCFFVAKNSEVFWMISIKYFSGTISECEMTGHIGYFAKKQNNVIQMNLWIHPLLNYSRKYRIFDLFLHNWYSVSGLNQQLPLCKSGTLPIELTEHKNGQLAENQTRSWRATSSRAIITLLTASSKSGAVDWN